MPHSGSSFARLPLAVGIVLLATGCEASSVVSLGVRDREHALDAMPRLDASVTSPAFPLYGPGVPPKAVMLFDPPPVPSGSPQAVYPLDGSMHPPNMAPTFQWTRGAANNDLFRIRFQGERTYDLYVACNATAPHCAFDVPRAAWTVIAAENAGRAVVVTLAGTSAKGGAVAQAGSMSLWFTPEWVDGGLYYWSTKLRGVKRVSFGAERVGATPFIAPGSESNRYACGGCHSVSRDGSTIAFTVSPTAEFDRAAPWGIRIAPTTAPERATVDPQPERAPPRNMRENPYFLGNSVALNRDGTLAAVNRWPWFEIWDARRGIPIVSLETRHPNFSPAEFVALPEWAPDSVLGAPTRIAVTTIPREQDGEWDFYTASGTIAIMSYEDGKLGPPQPLVRNAPSAPGWYHFYPTWSPDGTWIAFVSAPPSRNVFTENSSSVTDGVLRLVRSTGGPYECPGPQCYELERGTRYSVAAALARTGTGSTWPKINPFLLPRTGPGKERFLFVSYTNRGDYGFLSSGRSQLWMFAVDLRRLESGQDASFAPIWIPFQDVGDGALEPFWAEALTCSRRPDGTCLGCAVGEGCDVNPRTQRCECAAIVP